MTDPSPSRVSGSLPLIGVVAAAVCSIAAVAYFCISSSAKRDEPSRAAEEEAAKAAAHMRGLAEQGKTYREQVQQEELQRRAEAEGQLLRALLAPPSEEAVRQRKDEEKSFQALIRAHDGKDRCKADSDCRVVLIDGCCSYAAVNTASASRFPERQQLCRMAKRCPSRGAGTCVRRVCVKPGRPHQDVGR